MQSGQQHVYNPPSPQYIWPLQPTTWSRQRAATDAAQSKQTNHRPHPPLLPNAYPPTHPPLLPHATPPVHPTHSTRPQDSSNQSTHPPRTYTHKLFSDFHKMKITIAALTLGMLQLAAANEYDGAIYTTTPEEKV